MKYVLTSILKRSFSLTNYSLFSKIVPEAVIMGDEAGVPLKTVVKKMDDFAPRSLAESWDNVGLLVEPTSPIHVKNILLTNDLTEDVMEEALNVKANLIVAYHPPIFSAIKLINNRYVYRLHL